MHAALGAGERVNLVHDDRVHRLQNPRGLGGEHQIEALRGGNENVRGFACLPVTFGLRGIAGAHGHGDVRHIQLHALGHTGDAGQGCAEVILHVHAEGFERRNIEHPHALTRSRGGALQCRIVVEMQGLLTGALHHRIERPEESRQRLTGTRRGDNEGVLPLRDRFPRALLHRSRRGEDLLEPRGHLRVEAIENATGIPAHKSVRRSVRHAFTIDGRNITPNFPLLNTCGMLCGKLSVMLRYKSSRPQHTRTPRTR